MIARPEWLPDGTWRDPDCIECGGDGAPCCDPPDYPPPGIRAWLHWHFVGPLGQLQYWIRPYDMLAERRRWRWQQPAPCGRMLPPDLFEALTETARRKRGEW